MVPNTLLEMSYDTAKTQYWLLREVDRNIPTLAPHLGEWGKPSNLLSVGLGVTAIALAILGHYGIGPIRSNIAKTAAISYGLTSIALPLANKKSPA